MQNDRSARTLVAFAAAVLIGGGNFIAVSFSNRELPPLFGATIRFAIAAAAFFAMARLARAPRARKRSAAGAALYGLLGFGAAYGFLYYSLLGIPAGTAAVVVASAPLFTFVVAVLVRQERLSPRGLIGGVLAIGGIAVLSLDSFGGSIERGYLFAAIGGVLAIAGSSVVARSLRDVHPLTMNKIGTAVGAAFLALGSLVLDEPWTLPRQTPTVAAVVWLATIGSVALFQLFLHLIKSWGASAATYALTGMPLVAIALGAIMLSQPITPQILGGGAMVIAAVYIGAISRAKTAR